MLLATQKRLFILLRGMAELLGNSTHHEKFCCSIGIATFRVDLDPPEYRFASPVAVVVAHSWWNKSPGSFIEQGEDSGKPELKLCERSHA